MRIRNICIVLIGIIMVLCDSVLAGSLDYSNISDDEKKK